MGGIRTPKNRSIYEATAERAGIRKCTDTLHEMKIMVKDSKIHEATRESILVVIQALETKYESLMYELNDEVEATLEAMNEENSKHKEGVEVMFNELAD